MKTKPVILSIALSLFLISGVFAQEKYEFAMVEYSWSEGSIIFTTAGNQEIATTKVKESRGDLLRKVNELNDKGWEVYDITREGVSITYYLRKKKN